ncbi:MAG: putative porin [Chitinophagales bacterium]
MLVSIPFHGHSRLAQQLLLAILWMAGLRVFAGTAGSDTAVVRQRSTHNDTWFYENEPNRKNRIDSSIYQIHRSDFVRGDGEEYFHLGNSGSAAYPIIFHPQPQVGFQFGMRQFSIYRYTKDSIRYYQLIRPYVELSYQLGLKREQIFRGQFANSHKKHWYYGTDFHVINSPGGYLNQATYVGGCNVYVLYHSKRKIFDLQTNLTYNEFKNQENRGLKSDIFYSDSTFFQKSLATVGLQKAKINHNEVAWYIKGTYNLGKHYLQRINDSTTERTLLPIFKISYQFDMERDRYRFLNKPNSTFDSLAMGPFVGSSDSFFYGTQIWRIGNTAFLDFDAKKLTSDSTYKELNFLMGAQAAIEYYDIKERFSHYRFANGSVGGYLKSNPALNPRLLYHARVQYFFSGYNRNDLLVDGGVGADFRKFGQLQVNASYQLRQPDYVFTSLQSDSFSWKNNFKKISVLRFGGEYTIPKVGITIAAYNHVLGNYVYLNPQRLPAQESKPMNILVLAFSNRFAIKGFHLDNDIWFQQVSGSDVVRLPKVVTKHSVYYEARVFKRVLWLAVGVDLRWYSTFYGNGYDPVSGQFYLQNDLALKYYPVLDVFLNAKIKSLRLFLTGTNLSRGIKQSGYYSTYLYPAADIGFRFGVKWRFFE